MVYHLCSHKRSRRAYTIRFIPPQKSESQESLRIFHLWLMVVLYVQVHVDYPKDEMLNQEEIIKICGLMLVLSWSSQLINDDKIEIVQSRYREFFNNNYLTQCTHVMIRFGKRRLNRIIPCYILLNEWFFDNISTNGSYYLDSSAWLNWRSIAI